MGGHAARDAKWPRLVPAFGHSPGLDEHTLHAPRTPCVRTERVGGAAGDGGKIVCVDALPVRADAAANAADGGRACLVYSLGSRLDFSFELDVVRRFGCEVHTFDCTVGSPKVGTVPTGVAFHPWCVGDTDEMRAISSDLGFGKGGEKFQYHTLATIAHTLGHGLGTAHGSVVDLLKMDIERHEFAVIASFPNASQFRARQVVFETHLHNAYGMWGRPVLHVEWAGLWGRLAALGYGTFSYEPNPMCLCCCEFSIRRAD